MRQTTLIALLALLAAVPLGLGGCASPASTRDVSSAGVVSSLTEQAAMHLADDTYSISTPGLPSWTNVAPEGIDTVSHGPHGAAGIGLYGVAVSSPNDVSADEIEYITTVLAEGPDGEVVEVPQTVRVTGFVSKASTVIEATYEGMEQLLVPIYIELYQTDRDKYLARMEALREIAPALAASVTEAVIRTVVPVAP
jgi:hypothetical protein